MKTKKTKIVSHNNLLSDDEILTSAALDELEKLRKWPFVDLDFAKEFKKVAEEIHQRRRVLKKVSKQKKLSYV